MAGQDSIALTETAIDSVVKPIKFKESDILIDSSAVEKRSFVPNLKEKYDDVAFEYEPKLKEKSSCAYFIFLSTLKFNPVPRGPIWPFDSAYDRIHRLITIISLILPWSRRSRHHDCNRFLCRVPTLQTFRALF